MFSRSCRFAASVACFGPIAFLLVVSTLASTRASACPAPQYNPQENSVGDAFPVDTALTYNGRRAAVRSAITMGPPTTPLIPYTNAVTFWDLTTTGAPVGPLATFGANGEGIDILGTTNGYQPSDLIEMTNTRCVAIGSGYSQWAAGLPLPQHDQTYIDLFNAGATPSVIARHVIGRTSSLTPQGQWAGFTNDVEITRDGAYALINSDNYICRLDIGSGSLESFNIGDVDGPYGAGSPHNYCTPNSAVDSIALTNDRAVVVTSRVDPQFPFRNTWVYLIDLGTPWQIVLAERIPITAPFEAQFRPHDVAITPSGKFAVVTSDRAVSLFDLGTDQLIATYYDPSASRVYQRQVDSVEVTDFQAVVISDDVSGGTPVWQIDVFAIAQTGLTLSATYRDQNPEPASRAHDLAIVPGQAQALVRTSYDNVFINDLANPPPQATLPILLSPSGSNAHEYLNYAPPTTPHTAFSSDSVVIGSPSEDSMVAVTIGARQTSPGSGVWQGYVDFINLAATPLQVVQQVITSAGPPPGVGALPLDLVLTRDRSEVVVRSSDPYADPSLLAGADLSVFSMTAPFNLLQGYGGRGLVMGADSVAAGHNGLGVPNNRKRIISTSEDLGPPRDGKVHLVDRP